MAANAVASPGPLLSFGEFQSIMAAMSSGASADPLATPAAPVAGGATPAQSEAASLLSQLDLLLPASRQGHGVTTDAAMKDRLLAFLGLDPSDLAARLKGAVAAGIISDAQYSQIADLLRAQAGLPTTTSPAGMPEASSNPAASATAPAVDPAVADSAAKAQSALADPSAVFNENPEPANMVYQFAFDGALGETFKAWLLRSYGGITDDHGLDLDLKGECPSYVLDKALNGEDLTEEEYKNLWEGIRTELGRDRGEWRSDASKRVSGEVLQTASQTDDTSQGYLCDPLDGRNLCWVDAQGKEIELSYPKDKNPTDSVPGLTIKGTSAAIHGDYSIPEGKRQPVVDFLSSLTPTSETQALSDAVKSGKVSSAQRDRIIQLADQTAVVSQGGSVDELYADATEFGEAIGEPVYALEQYQSWL